MYVEVDRRLWVVGVGVVGALSHGNRLQRRLHRTELAGGRKVDFGAPLELNVLSSSIEGGAAGTAPGEYKS